MGNLTQPYLEVEAVRQVDTVTAGLRVTGPVRSPSTEVFSDPDMPQSDALSYLILGRAPQSRGDEGQISRAALSLGLTQANKVTGALGEEFGIRQLTLEAEGSGEPDLGGRQRLPDRGPECPLWGRHLRADHHRGAALRPGQVLLS